LKRWDLPHFDSKQQLAGRRSITPGSWRIDTRFEGTQDIPNTVDRLKTVCQELSGPARWTRSGGMYTSINTAIDSDDGNPQLRKKVRQALDYWLNRLQSIAEEGKQRGEIHSAIDSRNWPC